MAKFKTVHTSRTIMFAELEKVMEFSIETDTFLASLGYNITGKKSNSGVAKTGNYLKSLYRFDTKDSSFNAFKYFWKNSDASNKPLLAFVYAINHDDLLAESYDVICSIKSGEIAKAESFGDYVNQLHPNRFSQKTYQAAGRRLLSSWKQAGFITGKVKNIRSQPEINYYVACFAFLLAYLKGARGEFIWNSIGVKALGIFESNLRELAIECAKRDMIQYQYAGSVTVVSFNNMLKKIGIHAI